MRLRKVVRIDAEPLQAAIGWLRRGDAVPVEVGLGAAWQARAADWRDDPTVDSACCLSTGSLIGGSPIEAMLDRLETLGRLTQDRLATARLVLVEALANAVLHGNLEDLLPHDGTARHHARGVGLCARRDGEAMAFSIVQEGPGLAGLAARLSAAGSRGDTADPLEPGGLGLFLIARLSARWAVDEDGRRLTIWL